MLAKAVEIAWHDDAPVWSVDVSPHNRIVTASGDKVARVWRFVADPHAHLSPPSLPPTSASQQPTVAVPTTASPTAGATKSSPPNPTSASGTNAGTSTTASHPPPPLVSASRPPKPLPRPDLTLIQWMCDLRAHATTINIARFSPDGAAIATAADHGEIVIWRLASPAPDADQPSSLAVDEAAPHERWQRVSTLRAHVQDVLDLSWTTDGTRLASASVDNNIMVWQLNDEALGKASSASSSSRAPVVLRHHSNFVQGVAFDPFGRLLASMGNDRALRIFTETATTWQQVASVASYPSDSRLFSDDAKFKNFFRRLEWSPDGSVLACPSGLQLPKSQKRLFAVHLFARNAWNAPVVQCGGLPSPPCAVRFSPVLYARRSKPPAKTVESPPKKPDNELNAATLSSPKELLPQTSNQSPQPLSGDTTETGEDLCSRTGGKAFAGFTYRMIFAVVCAETVLFYDTESLSRPFAVVEGLHVAEQTDVSWSADGRTAFVSSVDGYVSTICFTVDELGTPLSEEETPHWLLRQTSPDPTTVIAQRLKEKPAQAPAPVLVAPVRGKPVASPISTETRVESSTSIQKPPTPVVEKDPKLVQRSNPDRDDDPTNTNPKDTNTRDPSVPSSVTPKVECVEHDKRQCAPSDGTGIIPEPAKSHKRSLQRSRDENESSGDQSSTCSNERGENCRAPSPKRAKTTTEQEEQKYQPPSPAKTPNVRGYRIAARQPEQLQSEVITILSSDSEGSEKEASVRDANNSVTQTGVAERQNRGISESDHSSTSKSNDVSKISQTTPSSTSKKGAVRNNGGSAQKRRNKSGLVQTKFCFRKTSQAEGDRAVTSVLKIDTEAQECALENGPPKEAVLTQGEKSTTPDKPIVTAEKKHEKLAAPKTKHEPLAANRGSAIVTAAKDSLQPDATPAAVV